MPFKMLETCVDEGGWLTESEVETLYLRLRDHRVGCQLLQVVLQRSPAPFHKVSACTLALNRVLLRPWGDKVAPVRGL